jgi:antirepressor protein
MAEQQVEQHKDRSRDVLIPLEQAEVPFYDRAIIAVRLPDGRVAAVLSVLCEVIGLASAPQGRRIRADEVLTEQLLLAQVQTDGGPQAMDVLTAWAIPSWLQGIKLGKVAPEKRAAILAFKREAADILYRHFSQPRHALPTPATLVPELPITEPERPTQDAGSEMWITYYRQMAAWLEWQADIETWRGQVESRLEGVEEITRLIPELLERLGPQTLTPEHQATVKAMAGRLHEVSGATYGSIYGELNTAFHVGKYSDIPDAEWPEVATWIQRRIETAERRRS